MLRWFKFSILVIITPIICLARDLELSDIHFIMYKLFELHVENKGYNSTLVKRAFRIYLQNFDSERIYLLEKEAIPFLNMSEDEAQVILQRLEKGDYSDFEKLNRLAQRAISRSKGWRLNLVNSILENEDFIPKDGDYSFYPGSEDELRLRQKNLMKRFYLSMAKRSELSSMERKKKVFSLFDKKMMAHERKYLFEDFRAQKLPLSKQKNIFTLHILKALAKSLDTHTAFFSEEEAFDMRMSLEKEFEGIGVVLSEGIDGVQIADVIKNSPAERCGKVNVNDVIVKIDEKMVDGLSFEEVLDALKRENGKEVTLTLKHYPENSVSIVTLVREPISMDAERVTYTYEKYADGIIGKIVLKSFYDNGNGVTSENDLRKAILELSAIGKLQGVVLDLRENSGGFLSQAIKVAGLFLSNGVVAISKYSNNEIRYMRTVNGRPFYEGPLILLVSKLSASASEIVAQCLQDYGVALIVGDERTFGKGTIQYQTITDKKSDVFFKVTIGRYYTVSGRTTQVEGVIADIVVPTEFSPFEVGERYLEYSLKADRIGSSYEDKLLDLEGKIKLWFQKNYLPSLQKTKQFWKKILPELKKNSSARIAKDTEFQKFLKESNNAKKERFFSKNKFAEDLQMKESVNIIKEMIQLENKAPHPLAKRCLKSTLVPKAA